jgi:hypothetical protein
LNTFSAPADSASQRSFLSCFRDAEWLTEPPLRNTLIGHAERQYDYLLRKLPWGSTETVSYREIDQVLGLAIAMT